MFRFRHVLLLWMALAGGVACAADDQAVVKKIVVAIVIGSDKTDDYPTRTSVRKLTQMVSIARQK